MAQIDFTPPKLRFRMKKGASWNFKFRCVRQGSGDAILLNNVQIIAHVLINNVIAESFTLGNGILIATDYTFFVIQKKFFTVSIIAGVVTYDPPIEILPKGLFRIQVMLIDPEGLALFPVELEIEVVDSATDSTERAIPTNIQELIVQEGFVVSINSVQNPYIFSYSAGKLYIQIGNNAPEQLFDFAVLDNQIAGTIQSSINDFNSFLADNPTYEGQVQISAEDTSAYPTIFYRIAGRNFSPMMMELDENLNVIDNNNSIFS